MCYNNLWKVSDNMAYTQAGNKAVQKYSKKAYDQILFRVKKGEAEKIKVHAKSMGESLNGFISRAVNETMEKDKGGE